MNKFFKIFALLLTLVFVLSALVACDLLGGIPAGDADSSGTGGSGTGATYALDVYTLNDVHGKVVDNNSQPGLDEMTTYLKSKQEEQNTMFLSSGDMWQGTAESGLTKGNIITDWMNHLGFSAMAIGNHEFDWGESVIAKNAELADFPLLAINIFDRDTNKRVDYCDASVLVDKGQVQIGIIGAVGDCYSSISGDMSAGVYFKTDGELTSLVKAESNKLKAEGADFIIYLLHDGLSKSYSSEKYLTGNNYKNDSGVYYDTSLSNGYVDLVFEAHTHQSYVLKDEYGVYHLQGGGDNNKGMTHAQVVFNLDDNSTRVREAGFVRHNTYSTMADDPIVDNLIDKYDSDLGTIYDTIGTNKDTISSSQIKNHVARLYYEAGVKKWGAQYDIVLGGGYLSVRHPYDLNSGAVNYATLYTLLPFDNEIVLCKIKGKDLKSRYLENGSYYIYLGTYGTSIRNSIDDNKTYYIVTDTYNSTYSSNRLTVVASLGSVYARDLMAEYIASGGLS